MWKHAKLRSSGFSADRGFVSPADAAAAAAAIATAVAVAGSAPDASYGTGSTHFFLTFVD